MKLRGRFTLTLALAALAPITVAAVVTRQVLTSSFHKDYADIRNNAEAAVGREIVRLETEVNQAVSSLATKQNNLVGALLVMMARDGGAPASGPLNELRKSAVTIMSGLSLDTLTITDAVNGDRVLISPHNPGQHNQPNRDVATQIEAAHGTAYFTNDKIRNNSVVETALLCKAGRTLHESDQAVALSAGRRVDTKLLEAVRTSRVDTRIVTPTGDVILPAKVADWNSFAKDPPIRVPLPGAERGQVVAYVEIAISDGNLDALVLEVTLISVALAVLALAIVIGIGLLVARRTARDLDKLVDGSMAAARGDLDYRVPVRSEDEVGAVANAFNFMMEDLRTSKERLVIAERIAAWQEIARRLAHEIKNPLTPIQMAMDTLRKTWKKQHPSFDEILEESTTTVLQEADRLKHIVTEFSDFARMPKPEPSRVDVNDVIRSALSLYQGAVYVEMNLAPQLPHLDADRNQLQQVMLNLVENSRDAIGSRENGRITVTSKLGDASDRVLVTVEDNGPGVPTDLKDKVFAPYFTTKHAKGGTGLGLAIVHRIVSDHGGRIFISDAPGGGARFMVELPLRHGTALLASRI